jgi:DNA-binding transcriptional regulator YiaG
MKPAKPAAQSIRQYRKNINLTQSQAAAIVYVTPRAWQQWEAGVRAMHPAFFELFRLKTNMATTTKEVAKSS